MLRLAPSVVLRTVTEEEQDLTLEQRYALIPAVFDDGTDGWPHAVHDAVGRQRVAHRLLEKETVDD